MPGWGAFPSIPYGLVRHLLLGTKSLVRLHLQPTIAGHAQVAVFASRMGNQTYHCCQSFVVVIVFAEGSVLRSGQQISASTVRSTLRHRLSRSASFLASFLGLSVGCLCSRFKVSVERVPHVFDGKNCVIARRVYRFYLYFAC